MTSRERDTEKKLENAISEFTDQVEPADDAWAQLRGRADELSPVRSRTTWIGLGLAGAAAAILAVLGFAALTGDDDGSNVAAPSDGYEEPTEFVALTPEGELHRYAADGTDLGVVADTGWSADFSFEVPTFTVSVDGIVYYERQACPDVSVADVDVMAVPVDGGEPELVRRGASRPSVSPDGRRLSFVQQSSPPPECGEPAAIDENPLSGEVGAEQRYAVLDLESGEARPLDITPPGRHDTPGFSLPAGPAVWSPDGSTVLFSVVCTPSDTWCTPTTGASAYTLAAPATGGESRDVDSPEGIGDRSYAFAADDRAFVDVVDDETSDVFIAEFPTSIDRGSDDWVGSQVQLAPRDATGILSLSTVPADPVSPLLAVAETADTPAGTGHVLIFDDGVEADPVVLGEAELGTNVVSAAWVPGAPIDAPRPEPVTPETPSTRPAPETSTSTAPAPATPDGAADPESALSDWFQARGQTYSGQCPTTVEEELEDTWCVRIESETQGSVVFATGETYSEYSMLVYVTNTDSGWVVTGSEEINSGPLG